MDERESLTRRFEENRAHLRAVAYRMLGSLDEADDAVQEAWLRLSRPGTGTVENLRGWLTTVVGRVCLDMLRSRKSRREGSFEQSSGADTTGRAAGQADGGDPEQEAMMADSVGLALLVVLQALTPAERLAFVLHDAFAVPFDEIASIVGRSPAATRQLASRARRRVRPRSPTSSSPGSGRSSRPSSSPPGKATSGRCWRCSIRRSCSGPTAWSPSGAHRRRSAARRRWLGARSGAAPAPRDRRS